MNQPQENKLKVSNPERILRILQKLCQANLQVTIRPAGTENLSIRGKAMAVNNDQMLAGVRIGGISEKGMTLLPNGSKIQVEFIMMSTKVVFQSVILRRDETTILVQRPIALVSIERRKNARYATTPEMLGFVSLGCWRNLEADLLAPPFFSRHETISHQIRIADVSANGLCGMFQFPSLLAALKSGMTDTGAQLHLPMLEPIRIDLQIRWIKKVKEEVGDSQSGIRQLRTYRFGCEFAEPSENAMLMIRNFIHQLTQQGAI